MRTIIPIMIVMMLCFTQLALCQKQLVLLKKENVLLRLYPGDEIVLKLKGSKSVKTTYVNNLSDTAVVTHQDTVPFHTIDRIYFDQPRFYNKIGAALVILGSGFFLIDQFNVIVVNGQSPSLDNRVSRVSLTSVSIGLPLLLIRKKSEKIRHRTRLMTVEKGSAFYRPDTRTYIFTN